MQTFTNTLINIYFIYQLFFTQCLFIYHWDLILTEFILYHILPVTLFMSLYYGKEILDSSKFKKTNEIEGTFHSFRGIYSLYCLPRLIYKNTSNEK